MQAHRLLLPHHGLFVSPLGLSMVTAGAAADDAVMLMGFWFISTAIGAKPSGQIGVFWSKWEHSKFFSLLVLTSPFAAILVRQFRRLLACDAARGFAAEADEPAGASAKVVPRLPTPASEGQPEALLRLRAPLFCRESPAAAPLPLNVPFRWEREPFAAVCPREQDSHRLVGAL